MSESTNDCNKLRKCSIIFCCSFSARVAWLAIVHVYTVNTLIFSVLCRVVYRHVYGYSLSQSFSGCSDTPV